MRVRDPTRARKNKMCINGKIISIKQKGSDLRQLIRTDCNTCHICYSRKTLEWAHRCYTQYLQNPIGCYFVTFTLSDEYITDAPEKTEIARFHKTLRKHYERKKNNQPFKFFLVSEYGYKTERLHYHAIYFGLPYTQEETYISISNELSKLWKKGLCNVKPFDLTKVIYCLKYLHKDKELGNIKIASKNLGHISDEYIKYINSSENYENFKVKLGNQNISLPRYYRKKHMQDDQKSEFKNYFAQKDQKEREKLNFRTKLHNFELSEKRFRNN